ncbi:MAG: DUF4177 domain-containing protein [Oscillospiraceae bacterium]|nr:DUF4177 domain-containing protein [Oscillospiraceae bacterium]
MFEYAYERIEVSFAEWRLIGGGLITETDDYKRIIEKKARDGWRFVTWIPVKQRGEGMIEEIDLVFEREKS